MPNGGKLSTERLCGDAASSWKGARGTVTPVDALLANDQAIAGRNNKVRRADGGHAIPFALR
jgi:hypothetical protein